MSCLFDSLAALLPEGGGGAALRARVCEYMLDHLDREHAHGMTLRAWLRMVLEDDRRVGMRILSERRRAAHPMNGHVAIAEEEDRDALVLRYVEWMRAHDTWGGALELSLVARMCRVNIRVLDAHGHSVAHALAATDAEEDPASRTRSLVLHYDGAHYTPHPPSPPMATTTPPPPPRQRAHARARARAPHYPPPPHLRQHPSVRHRQRHGPPNVG